MSGNVLTMRTFGDVLKKRMSKTARKKYFDNSRNTFTLPPDAIERDATKQETLYDFLFESLVYKIQYEDGETKIPDFNKSWISETINGKIPLNSEVLKAAQKQEAAAVTAAYFNNNIVPNIPKHLLPVVVDSVGELIKEDAGLGAIKRASLKSAKDKKSEADYLAAVWVLAVCNCAECLERKQSNPSKPKAVEAQADTQIAPPPEAAPSTYAPSVSNAEGWCKREKMLVCVMSVLAAALVVALFLLLRLANAPAPEETLVVPDGPIVHTIEFYNVVTEAPPKPAMVIPLYNIPYIEIGDSECFRVSGNDEENRIVLFSKENEIISALFNKYNNYVVYDIDADASRFLATLNSPKYPLTYPELTYRILCDDEVRYEVTLEGNSQPVDVDINIRGTKRLAIEIELIGFSYNSISVSYYRGIQNARIITVGY